jgi:asparagine synthetase B (glutamine-hydrolysing)
MGRALAHRGPDEDRVVVRGRMGMAHRRLTIIDRLQRRDLQFP